MYGQTSWIRVKSRAQETGFSSPARCQKTTLRSAFIMAHEIAKLLLEQADSFLKRQEAIKEALDLGMPLREIEEYLDWLDIMKNGSVDEDNEQNGN